MRAKQRQVAAAVRFARKLQQALVLYMRFAPLPQRLSRKMLMLGANTERKPRPWLENARNSVEIASPTARHSVLLKAAACPMVWGKTVLPLRPQSTPWPHRIP